MRRLIAFVLCILMAAGIPVYALPEYALTLTPPDPLTEGGAIQIRFSVPEADECSLTILNENGETVSIVVDPYSAREGLNDVWWNGTWQGVAVPAGDWVLCMEYQGRRLTAPLRIQPEGAGEAPADVGNEAVALTEGTDGAGETGSGIEDPEGLTAGWNEEGPAASAEEDPGDLTEDWAEADPEALTEDWAEEDPEALTEDWAEEDPEALTADWAEADPEALTEDWAEADPDGLTEEWTEEEPDGEEDGGLLEEETTETVMLDQSQFTPSFSSPYAGQDTEMNYWTLPMDITDTEAVWKMLTAPITILDNGKKNMEKTQVVVYSEPDENSEGIGMCTAATQGVHVLERGDEWSLIECYSSSFHDSPVINWNTLIQGYVPTKYLKEVKPNQEIGIVIDKLTQRLYLFQKGEQIATLLVSTGVSNPRQPYNETRSGEFLMASKVGTFASDNMRCALAIRFNDGDLLHEVPYTLLKDGGKNYKNNEPKLGKRASHGCIRVQRKKTPEGISMQWIWNNKKKNMKMVIWEDWQGRQLSYPSDDTVLYYNPNGGESYHSASTCYSVNLKKTFEPFTYGELDTGDFAKLTRCEYCTPPIRKAEIDEINEEHAVGGDHDPILTEYRTMCPMTNAEWKKIQPKN